MSESNKLASLRVKSTKIHRYLNIFTGFIVLFTLIFLFTTIIAIFSPQNAFEATSGVAHWHITFQTTFFKTAHFSQVIPFTMLANLTDHLMFEAKHAFVTYHLCYGGFYFGFILYGINQVKEILYSLEVEYTPFTEKNKQHLKRIAWAVILYSLFAELITNIAINIFVTQIFNIYLQHINITGLIIGALLLILVHIFEIGIHLQEESDTTL